MLEDFSNYSVLQSLLMVAVLLFFVIFLYIRYWQRYISPYLGGTTRPGQPIDVTPMADRLQQVRQNYPAGKNPRHHLKRTRALAAVRATLQRLSFFRDSETQPKL